MALLLRIMDMLAPNGKPVSATHFDLWCRTYDDSFVIVSKAREMAYFAGFTGEGRTTPGQLAFANWRRWALYALRAERWGR